MQFLRRLVLVLGTVGWVVGGVTPAHATINLTGNFKAIFHLLPPFDGLFGGGGSCSIDFLQSGSTLSTTGTCDIVGPIPLSGSIDSSTGAFTLTGTNVGPCATLNFGGLATANSQSFDGGIQCLGVFPGGIGATIHGSRCGNNQLDPGEQCDDGNFNDGDCCSSTCQHDAPGATCFSDFNPCTDDVCNGAGVCQHPDNTLPCDDGNDCTGNDTCNGAGSCVGTVLSAGSPCDDFDDCTVVDACDGAGTCNPGPPQDCGPCMECLSGFGCTAYTVVLDECAAPKVPVEPKSPLVIRDGTPDTRDKLVWKFSKGTATAVTDFGNPRTTTNYKLCVFNQSQGFGFFDNAIMAARIPAAGTCGGAPCWIGNSKGYKFKNRAGNDDGINQVLLVSGPRGKTKAVVEGKGANLHLPSLPIDLTNPILVRLQADNGQCWQSQYTSASPNNPVAFKGLGGSPSGAFLLD